MKDSINSNLVYSDNTIRIRREFYFNFNVTEVYEGSDVTAVLSMNSCGVHEDGLLHLKVTFEFPYEVITDYICVSKMDNFSKIYAFPIKSGSFIKVSIKDENSQINFEKKLIVLAYSFDPENFKNVSQLYPYD